MRALHVVASVVCLSLVPAVAVGADEVNPKPRFGLAAGVSSLGASVQPSVRVSDEVVLRLNASAGQHDGTYTIAGDDYGVDLGVKTAGLIVDWHPFESGFRVSAGVFGNWSSADIAREVSVTHPLAGTISTSIEGDVTVSRLNPYVGLGYDARLFSDSGWSLWGEIGALYIGGVEVSARDTRGILPEKVIREEADRIEGALDLPVYPVVGIGFRYRF